MSVKPPVLLCPLCKRFPRGFGYSDPRYRLWTSLGQHSTRVFCSRQHQQLYHAIKRKHGEDIVIDPAPHEIAAMRAAVKPLSEYIEHEIGWETPLMEYDRDEILTLIEVIITAYHDALLTAAEKQWPEIDIPFDPKRMGE